MSNPTTVTLVLNHLGGKAGALDGAINTTISAKEGNTGGVIAGTITGVGSAAGMFPGKFPGPLGGLAVTVANLTKTGGDVSQLTLGDILTIGAGVAAIAGAPILGFGLGVAGLGWTIYTLRNPEANLTVEQLLNRLRPAPDFNVIDPIKQQTQTASTIPSPLS